MASNNRFVSPTDRLKLSNDYASVDHDHTGVYQPIATGTPDGTKYLRDDNTWQPVTGGSGLSQQQVEAIAFLRS